MLTRAFCMCCLLARVAHGAGPTYESIRGTGYAEVTLPVNTLRVKIPVYCEAEDLRGALRLLDVRRDAARKEAVELGAVDASISFSDPETVSDDGPPLPPSGLLPIAVDLENPAPTPAEPPDASELEIAGEDSITSMPPAKLVMVSATLKADFLIRGKTGDERLIEISELRDRIKAADLSGISELERRREEHMQRGESVANLPCVCGLGKSQYSTSSSLAQSERTALVEAALSNAQKNALGLAAAAHVRLGELTRLASSEIEPARPELQAASVSSADAKGLHTYTVMVTATYAVDAQFSTALASEHP